MIAALAGILKTKEPTRIIVDCNGIGFEVGIPLSTYRNLSEPGSRVELFIITRFPREGIELYGFTDRAQRDVFSLLTSVSGIGPKAGLNMLSRFAPEEILEVIATGRIEVLRTVPGIGPKKAQRMLEELAEKTVPVVHTEPLIADAESALVGLGLTRREAHTRLSNIKVTPEMTLEGLLKLALQHKE